MVQIAPSRRDIVVRVGHIDQRQAAEQSGEQPANSMHIDKSLFHSVSEDDKPDLVADARGPEEGGELEVVGDHALDIAQDRTALGRLIDR